MLSKHLSRPLTRALPVGARAAAPFSSQPPDSNTHQEWSPLWVASLLRSLHKPQEVDYYLNNFAEQSGGGGGGGTGTGGLGGLQGPQVFWPPPDPLAILAQAALLEACWLLS